MFIRRFRLFYYLLDRHYHWEHMGFYDLSKEERKKLVEEMRNEVLSDLEQNKLDNIKKYGSDDDTYIRKNVYLILGRNYRDEENHRDDILDIAEELIHSGDEKLRQTAVYTMGEIGKIEADKVLGFFKLALADESHSVRNAVVGSLKKMGESNPEPTLKFAKKFLHHPDPEIRKIIVHGIELRGRTHPQDILPLLEELQEDPDRKVRGKIVHVLSQISYKEGCLEKVVSALKNWENDELVRKALDEIIDVHERYKNFSTKSTKEAKKYIEKNFELTL